eukprot:gene9210-10170_t
MKRTSNLAKFVFLGAPGVGKGTYAKMLIDRSERRWKHLSPGDFIRKEMTSGSVIGQELASYVHAGKLVPEDLMSKYWLPNVAKIMEEMENAVASSSSSSSMDDDKTIGIILDGYPRTIDQCKLLDEVIPSTNGNKFLAMNITLRRDIAVMKLLGRCHCERCGKSYNTEGLVDHEYDMPPILPAEPCKNSPTQGSCRESFSKRVDDTPEVIHARLEDYDNRLDPILQYYRDQNRLAEMDVKKGVKDIDRLWSIMMDRFHHNKENR